MWIGSSIELLRYATYIKKEWLSHDNQSSLLTLNLIP